MKIFGGPWGHRELEVIPTPVGQLCLYCVEPIVEGDLGIEQPFHSLEKETTVVHHRECFLRSIFGSVGHQQQKCSCYGGTDEDPPGLSRREAARAAVEEMLMKAEQQRS
jgi:hypothetical protein